jgi:hypothetical protein
MELAIGENNNRLKINEYIEVNYFKSKFEWSDYGYDRTRKFG